VALSFRLDGLSLLFALLITGIGALVIFYAAAYLGEKPGLGRFLALILLFLFAMLGLVLADNLGCLFVFWELTSISSYLLIGFRHRREGARAAALQALLVTGAGGLALLAGFLLLGQAGGTFEITELAGNADRVRSHDLYFPALLLVLLGAFTKSAQFPFHFWLPGAMEAPAPVSAYLHSATMVNAGIYLLARLSGVLGGTDAWYRLITWAGAATMLFGALAAFPQRDMKRLLALSTVSVLGTLTLLVGLDTAASMKAAMVLLLVHSLYKAALFLAAGSVEHETGTRDLSELSGLRGTMPWTALAACLAALSMAGLPPLLGFIGKELLYEAKIQAPEGAIAVTLAGVGGNIVMVVLAGLLSVRLFFGRSRWPGGAPHEAPSAMWLAPLAMAGLGLAIGLAPGSASAVVEPAVNAVRAEHVVVDLKLWHGLNPVLALSVFTLLGGGCLFAAHGRLARFARHLQAPGWGPSRWYETAIGSATALARAQTRVLQSGYLRIYLSVVLTTAVLAAGYPLLRHASWREGGWTNDFQIHELALAATILLAAVAVVRSTSRLAAVAALGAAGFGVSLLFLLFGAPDLAITQFAVETLSVILFVLVLYRLPRFARLSSARARFRDAAVALAGGGLMTGLLLAVTAGPPASRLAPYFAANSLSAANGRNIVNVILVDFRALDTLGEITVLAAAAIGVLTLLRAGAGGKGAA
jgi:multicomponent Na+:H+ antiporter subunit A